MHSDWINQFLNNRPSLTSSYIPTRLPVTVETEDQHWDNARSAHKNKVKSHDRACNDNMEI